MHTALLLRRSVAVAFAVGLIEFALTPDAGADAGNCAEFNAGSWSYIYVPSTDALKLAGPMTMEAWIKPVAGGGEWTLILGKQFNAGDANPWYSYRFLAASANAGEKGFPRRVNFNVAPVGSGEAGVTSTTTVPVNVWTHIAGVHDGTNLIIYINGIRESSTPLASSIWESDLGLYMGKAPWTGYNNYNGQMDEIRLWNVARTQAQIQTKMNRSLVGNENGLVAYWPFNDAPGSSTTDDMSQNSHTGTLYNGAAIVANSTAPISAANEPPVAGADTASTLEDNAVVINVLTNDTDIDGDALTITAKTDGTNGTVAITGGGTNVTYTPAENWNGSDSFTYTVSDGNGGFATGTVNVTVSAVNDPPVAGADSASTLEDNAVVINVLTNDTDVDADALTITAKTDGTNGTVAITGGGTNVTYTPNADWNSNDSFTYTVSDGNGGLATSTVNVTVSAVNDAPVAANDTATTLEDNAIVIKVLANDTDIDGGALTITAKTDGAHGTAAITGGGRNVTYTPAANWHGSDSFTYTVSDGNGGLAIGSVNVTVGFFGKLDYDGDGVSDLAVYAATGGAWYINYSSGGTAKIFWGFVGSATVPGDYDGDGLSDLSIFDKASGRWYIRTIAEAVLARNFNWGWPGATPVVGDYDGDGKDDLAVFDENTGRWHIYSLAKQQVLNWNVYWGWRGAKPVSGDYNGDGKSDLAVLDPNIGCWYIYSLDGRALAWKFDWGCAGAQYLPGDFDGDGASDLAAYVPNTCKWYIYSLKRKQALAWGVYWGLAGATPVSGDYNGDGITDLALYHQAAGKWYIRTLAGNVLAWAKSWGWSATTPVKP